jgi:hypothetical protein
VEDLVKATKAAEKPVLVTRESQQVHPGEASILITVEEELMHVLFKLCEQGIRVNT